MDACKLEQESMCEGVEAGGGRMHKCLYEHFDKLSVACKDFEFNTQVSLLHVHSSQRTNHLTV